MAKWSAKDPSDVRDYYFDWTDLLAADETIDAHTITMPTGVTATEDEHDDKTVRVRISGGAADVSYDIDCLITTSTGQTLDITNTLKVAERKGR
jgi:hypothetical protein